MKVFQLQELVVRFFNEHLHQQRQVSRHTILSYRDRVRLLLGFLKRTYHVCPATVEFLPVVEAAALFVVVAGKVRGFHKGPGQIRVAAFAVESEPPHVGSELAFILNSARLFRRKAGP
jgi:site-specific recombinase XerC